MHDVTVTPHDLIQEIWEQITWKIANYGEIDITIKLFLNGFYLTEILVLINRSFVFYDKIG